jgi:2-polyprenyl-3-methyl-5-hydroxy-6-metoxy-1,4-benzoquinol methylase
MKNFNNSCPVCSSLMTTGSAPWHFVCCRCAYEGANLEPQINQQESHSSIDEAARHDGLEDLRKQNFSKLLRELVRLRPSGGRLLDVGCAHGWFLEMASANFEVSGIEPDEAVAAATVARGLKVRPGYFPDVLNADERFDIIAFNDVIEHIPNIKSVLVACQAHLNPGGLLVINLPNSQGLFYRLSKVFKFFGASGFFERLWQVGFPSPHVHYFNSENLNTLVSGSKFSVVCSGTLATLRREGLYTRISYSTKSSRIRNFLVYAGTLAAMPFLKLLPSDIIFSIYKK